MIWNAEYDPAKDGSGFGGGSGYGFGGRHGLAALMRSAWEQRSVNDG